MASDGPADLFLFRTDWTAMQPFFARAAQLPPSEQAFGDRYGAFPDPGAVQRFVSTLRDVNDVARRLGDPDTMKRRIAEDGEYLLRPDPPAEVYAHLVWLAMHVSGVAATLGDGLRALRGSLTAGVGTSERALRVKGLVAGDAGLMPTASATAAKVEAVRAELGPLLAGVNGALQAFNDAPVLGQANEAIGAFQSRLARLEKQAAEAKKKSEGWLGRATALEAWRELATDIEAGQAELRRKELLIGDTADFFTAGAAVPPALRSADDRLRRLAKVFADAAEAWRTTARVSNAEQLGSSEWLTRALDLPTAADAWDGIQAAASGFVQGAMLSLDLSRDGGQGVAR